MQNIDALYEKWLKHPEMPKKLVSELKKMSAKLKQTPFIKMPSLAQRECAEF